MEDKRGPGYYKIDLSTLSGPKISMSVKGIGPKHPSELIKTPGPGKYDPVKVSLRKSNSCSMFWHGKDIRHDFKNGPGSYEISKPLGMPQVPIAYNN